MRFLEREGGFRRGGPAANCCDQRQQVTWMRAIFLSRDRLKLTITSGVGCRITRQRFLSKYVLASGDNRTFPVLAGPYDQHFATVFEDELRFLLRDYVGGPIFHFRKAFSTFFHFAGKTNDHVMFVGLGVDRDGAEFGCIDPHCLLQIPSERRRFLGYGRGPPNSQRMGQRRHYPYWSRPDRVPSPAGRIQFSSLATAVSGQILGCPGCVSLGA